jgi:hypothetical protein
VKSGNSEKSGDSDEEADDKPAVCTFDEAVSVYKL